MSNTQQFHPPAQDRPHLLSDLRLALSVLYSLPTQQPVPNNISSKDAHDYLMQFQARNIRRKLKSQNQRNNDQIPGQQEHHQQQHPTIDNTDTGSSWLACLALLTSLIGSHPVEYAEALFAAQTIEHRLRKVKLCESIDIEVEPPLIIPIGNVQSVQLYQAFSKWRHVLGGNICDLPHPSPEKDEDSTKGEISLLMIAELIYCLILRYNNEGLLNQIRPLLTTLASALAVVAGRIRYTPKAASHPANDTQPVVKMIIQTLQHIHRTMSSNTANHNESPERLIEVYSFALYTCMTAIPDAILSGSGSGGRLSIEPRCYTSLTTEVRTEGIILVCKSFIDLPAPHGVFRVMFLHMCEEWAKSVPLPSEFIDSSIPMVESAFSNMLAPHATQQCLDEGHAAMRYWIAIMEGGSWTLDKILAASLFQGAESSQQAGKKRQSSRSKKRQKEALEEKTTANLAADAQNELAHRGTVACRATILTWNSFRELLAKDLASVTNRDDEVLGDFAVGGICACATACLPFLLKQPDTQDQINLFGLIGEAVADVCRSPSQMVRGFASEPLYALQAALVDASSNNIKISETIQEGVANIFFQCAMSLAARCAYPPGYFDDLTANNDDELENERNDVRDILRVVSSIPSGKHKQTLPSAENIAGSTLQRLLQACKDSILLPTESGTNIFMESALHAFSALVKPLNTLSLVYVESPSESAKQLLDLALDIAIGTGQRILSSFSESPVSDILPLCRLYNLASASFSPMLSMLSSKSEFRTQVFSVVSIFIKVAIESLTKLPELVSPSTLRQSRFDIRGAMRSPGGEDHVGVLTLMRLTGESDQLTQIFIRTSPSVVEELCHLYQMLKAFENERGRGVLHGIGVLPKSRRILLGILCHLSASANVDTSISAALKAMFMKSVSEIASLRPVTVTVDSLFLICELVFDMAAYSPMIVQSFFDFEIAEPTLQQTQCLDVLQHLGLVGFEMTATTATKDHEILYQWNRLRAALFCLLQQSRNPDLPSSIVNIMIIWTKAECQAIQRQCRLGPTSSSSIFCEELISEESVPSGTTIRVLAEMIDDSVRRQIPLDSMSNCTRVMLEVRGEVLATITCECPDPYGKDAFSDPRPTLAESWLLATSKMLESVAADSGHAINSLNAIESIVVDSCVSSIGLLFYPSMGKTQRARLNDPGMSFDGPQTLLLIEFLRLYFLLGPAFLIAAAKRLLSTIPVEEASVQRLSTEDDAIGISIIGSSLFRAAQGGLPPWAIEFIPGVYSSIYFSLNSDPMKFHLIFAMSLELRVNSNFGAVQPGRLLSGRFFETLSERAKSKFLEESVALAQTNTPASWKRLKILIKQTCGGKKKDTDFRQKPSLTKFDCLDRI